MAHETKDRQRGQIDRKKVERTTEADIERHAAEDGEADWFDAEAGPDRVVHPYRPRR